MGLLLGMSIQAWMDFTKTSFFLVSSIFLSLIATNILLQKLRLFQSPTDPPVVFHWIPFIGSTVTYGIDPYKFFFKCRHKVFEKIFTFLPFPHPFPPDFPYLVPVPYF